MNSTSLTTRVAVLAAFLSAATAVAEPIQRSNNGVPIPPNAVALNQLNRLSQRAVVSASTSDDVAQAAATEVKEARDFYRSLQANKDTAVPSQVVSQAKGMLIIDEWTGALGVGLAGGNALGFVKNSDGTFSKPAFYSVAGGSIGPRLGASHTRAIVFLMTDRAMEGFKEGQFVGNNVALAVIGEKAALAADTLQKSDVIVYQSANGLDIGASLGGIKLAVDKTRNEAYYRYFGSNPTDVLAGAGQTPEEVKSLLAEVNPPRDGPYMLAGGALY